MTALNCDLISQSVSEDTKHAAVSTDLCEFGNEAHLHTKGPSLHPMYVTYFKYVPNQVFGSFLKRKNTLVSSATPKDPRKTTVVDDRRRKTPSQQLARSRTLSNTN